MARILVKQPNGRYAEFSTIVDSFVFWDATVEEAVAYARQEAADKAEKDMREAIDNVDAGRHRHAYGHLEWPKALELHNLHSNDKLDNDGARLPEGKEGV